jgi:hypothetical protein
MVDAETSRKPLIYRMFAGSWNPTEFGQKKMAVASLILESVRWALQGRYPELVHPTAPGVPEWTRLFYAIQMIFFFAATVAAGCHVIDAIRLRSRKHLNAIGLVLYLALWLEVGWANGYVSGLAR